MVLIKLLCIFLYHYYCECSDDTTLRLKSQNEFVNLPPSASEYYIKWEKQQCGCERVMLNSEHNRVYMCHNRILPSVVELRMIVNSFFKSNLEFRNVSSNYLVHLHIKNLLLQC